VYGATAAWILALAAAFAGLALYAGRPGQAASPTPTLRSPPRERWRLMMFLHPRCACSRASLSELARLLARLRDRVDAEVLFVDPDGAPTADDRSLWSQASAIHGAKVSRDAHAAEARRMGALTSGQVLLFRPDGRLAFAGGMTPSRAHEGPNAGAMAITALVDGRAPARDRTAVFGCALFGAER